MSANKVWSKDAMDVDNVWDDTELIKMYEESIKEVYKPAKSGVTEKKFTAADGTEYLWKVGETCMAPFTENGETENYAARIDSFGGEGGMEVTVTFIYYKNTAAVHISDLWRNEEAVAHAIELEENLEKESNNKKSRHNSGKHAASKPSTSNSSVPLPALAPPVPPNVINMVPPNKQEALSSMLMSWYMSGYHTGYYQAMNDRQANE